MNPWQVSAAGPPSDMAGTLKKLGPVEAYTLRIRKTEADCQLVEAAARFKSLELSAWARFELVALARKILTKKSG